jgi:GAF domain-containing protein
VFEACGCVHPQRTASSGRRIVEGVIGSAIFALILWLISRLDASVPLWVLFLVLVLLLVAFSVGHRVPRSEDLIGERADHLGEIILTLRDLLAGKLRGVTFEEFIERGVLAPASFGLRRRRDEEIRLSVLELDASDQQFRMTYEAGHGVGRKADFRLGLTTMAGHAYKSRDLQWTNDVEADERWTRHEKARPGRDYGSLAVAPIIVGDNVVAVLNVLSTKKGAFFKGDLTYIELLATLIGLAWALRPDAAAGGPRLPKSQEPPAR